MPLTPPSPLQALFQHALTLHRSGRAEEAEKAYRQVMKVDARHQQARCLLGLLYLDEGRNAEAEKVLEAAARLDGREIRGLAAYGVALVRVGKFRNAATVLERAVALAPADPSLRSHLGDALQGQGRLEEAVAAYDEALRHDPALVEGLGRRAAALAGLKRFEAALADCTRALASAPRDPRALAVRARALGALGRPDEAVAAYGAAIAAAPDDHTLMVDLARLLFEADRPAEAVEACTAVLTVRPRNPEVLRLRSAALTRLLRLEAALADCDAAIALAPRDPEGHLARALRLEALGRAEEAVASFDRVLALRDRRTPEHLQALYSRCTVLIELKRYGEAIEGLQRILAADPRHVFALGLYAQARLAACDWAGREALAAALRDAVEGGEADVPPGTLAAWFDDPALLLKGSRNHAARYMGPVTAARPAPAPGGERLRIAYLSADFHNHATAQLAIELFERHDRSRFDISAISFGPDDGSNMRAACFAAFETFLDARTMGDAAIGVWMRARGIDIAVDLKGFTGGARERVFVQRPAPLLVNYLGFPGTLGTAVYDYILADAVVAPMAMQPFFAERIVHLPNSYQPNDSRRGVPETTLTRAEAGLPAAGFVFASFNNSYKITPPVFDVWMRLLAATDGAVLWLLGDNDLAMENLRREAAARGIDPARLVFAPRVAPNEHLARQRLADLFLDTQPCGAHTTASDALWMGLPMVTCLGGAFAGRVGASLLHAVGLADLVAADLAAYERLALSLARDQARLAAIRARLETGRLTLPLFDADLYRRGVETAYEMMWARCLSGEPPTAFAVDLNIRPPPSRHEPS